MPILTIRLELLQSRVTFRPPLEESTSVTSVQEVIRDWVNKFLDRARSVQMLGPKVRFTYYRYTSVCMCPRIGTNACIYILL